MGTGMEFRPTDEGFFFVGVGRKYGGPCRGESCSNLGIPPADEERPLARLVIIADYRLFPIPLRSGRIREVQAAL